MPGIVMEIKYKILKGKNQINRKIKYKSQKARTK
jgi:hypothetical protein